MDSRNKLDVKVNDKGNIEISFNTLEEIKKFINIIFLNGRLIESKIKGEGNFCILEMAPEYYVSIYDKKKHGNIFDNQKSLVQFKFLALDEAKDCRKTLNEMGIEVVTILRHPSGEIYKDLSAHDGIDTNDNLKYILRIDKKNKEKYDLYFEYKEQLITVVEGCYREKIIKLKTKAPDVPFPYLLKGEDLQILQSSNQVKFKNIINFLENEANVLINASPKTKEEVNTIKSKWAIFREIIDSVDMIELKKFKELMQEAKIQILMKSERLLDALLEQSQERLKLVEEEKNASNAASQQWETSYKQVAAKLESASQTISDYQRQLAATSERLSESQNQFLTQSQLNLNQSAPLTQAYPTTPYPMPYMAPYPLPYPPPPIPFYPYPPHSPYLTATDPNRLFASQSSQLRSSMITGSNLNISLTQQRK